MGLTDAGFQTDIPTMIRIFDYIFALRPMLIIPVWTIFLLGYFRAGGRLSIFELAAALMSATLAAGAVFVLNQLCDLESDRINDKGQFFTKGILTIQAGLILTIILDLLAFGLGALISLEFAIGIAIVIILGILYSVKPISLKDRPIPAFLINGFGHGSLVFLLGWLAADGGIRPGFYYSVPYFLAVGAIYIGTTIPDIKGDTATGKITLAVVLGDFYCGLLILIMMAAAVVTAVFLGDTAMFYAGCAVLVFQLASVIFRSRKLQVLTVKIAILILSLAAGVKFPLYIFWLMGVITATRIYHKYRLGLEYPSLAA